MLNKGCKLKSDPRVKLGRKASISEFNSILRQASIILKAQNTKMCRYWNYLDNFVNHLFQDNVNSKMKTDLVKIARKALERAEQIKGIERKSSPTHSVTGPGK